MRKGLVFVIDCSGGGGGGGGDGGGICQEFYLPTTVCWLWEKQQEVSTQSNDDETVLTAAYVHLDGSLFPRKEDI